jgi:hypothetical protein
MLTFRATYRFECIIGRLQLRLDGQVRTDGKLDLDKLYSFAKKHGVETCPAAYDYRRSAAQEG